MRIIAFKAGGIASNITGAGGTLTGSLFLTGNPTQTLEAAPKQYVDSTLNVHSGNATIHITSGEKSLLDGITVSTTEINRLVGVTSAIQIQLDAKLPLAGGTLTGFLTAHANPTSALHVTTKQYVDNAISGSSSFVVADIVTKPYSTTPTGFLRCNGAYVSKVTYSTLYAVIGNTMDTVATGYDYSIYHAVGAGQPHRQQYNINTTQNTDITGWITGTALPGVLALSQAIVTKNRVYLLGGYNNTAYVSAVYTAPINSDGTLGTWTTGTSLPGVLGQSQAIVTKNRVYMLGGYNGTAYASAVYTAPINSDGTLGTWTTGTALPGVLGASQAIVTKNRIYLLGGYSAGYVSTVYTAPINSDGTLGTWATGTALPGVMGYIQAIVTKNRVYLLGGYDGTNWISTVYTAPINADGTLGTWTTGTSLPGVVAGSQAIVTKGRIYLLGGSNSINNAIITVYTAPINADGTLGTWSTGTSLPGALGYSQAIVTKNRVYLLGGFNMYWVVTVYTAYISDGLNDLSPYYDGTINKYDGTDPTGTTNPDNATLFGLPDSTTYDAKISKVYSYIKY